MRCHSYTKELGMVMAWSRSGWYLLLLLLSLSLPMSAFAQDSLCAEVKIEILQKLSLERQAFDAHMRITNGLDTSAIESVGAVLHFQDDKGNEVLATSDPNNTSASFFARIDSLSGIGAIDGSGLVNPKSTADIHWLIIPAQGTGGTGPGGKLYYIGATLTYTLLGQQSAIDVTPDFVTVKPQPLLDIDYFLAGDVYADDPFTPEIEPPIPFTLGVRINNVGAGAANKVTIESAQPKIVENKQGLLIDFKIIDSYVSDQPAGKTLLIDFGDIAPGTAKVGRWNMITTLSGKFVEISATYTHADSLGGALTSLIRNINSYLLVHDVKVDLPGRDGIRDFLALSGDVLRVYESDGGDSPVIDQSSKAALQSGSPYQFNFPATTGFAYAKVTDPYAGKRTPNNVKRSDGKLILPENVWLSQIRDANNNWQYFVNIFDANTTGRYTLDFVSGATGDIGGIVYNDVNNNGKKDDTEEGMGNVKVTLQGTDNDGAGVSVSGYTLADGTYQFVSLKPGNYRLKVDPIDGYVNGARTIGNAGGTVAADEDDLITGIVLLAGANASGYNFAKRKPSSSTGEADLAIAMTASQTTVRSDDTVVFTLTAGNAGPAAATDVAVTSPLPQGLSLVSAATTTGGYDPASGVWTLGALNKGATATLTLTAKVGTINGSITQTATIASSLLDPNPANNIAQVTLTAADAVFSLTSRLVEEARILALVSCPDTTGEDDPACAKAKADWLAAYLAGRGYSAQVVTTTEAFRTQLRAGKYNTYWLNGGANKLTAPLADEVRLAVGRGDALITDGVHDAQSAVFDNVTGTAIGATPGSSMVVIDGETVATAGTATALTLQGATALASFADGTSVAAASHAYGQGATLSAGFDLIGSLQIPASEPVLRAFLADALKALTPKTPATVVGNSYLPVALDVSHSDNSAVTATVSVVLPAGVKFVDASPAPSAVAPDRVTWTLALAAADMQSLRLGLRAPAANTALHLTGSIAEANPAITSDLAIDVTHFDAPRMTALVAQINEPAAAQEAQAAQTAFTAADYDSAITALVTTDQALPADTATTLRQGVSSWLQEAELLWQQNTAPPSTPASIAAMSGTPQTAVILTAFTQVLQAQVLDAGSQPVANAAVSFNLPVTGAGGTFAGGGASVTATTDMQGLATSPIVFANGTAGNYVATATVPGVTQPANFALTNQSTAQVPATITALSGTPQSATVNTVFAQALQAIVRDAANQPVAGVTVTFALPVTGASATFAGGGGMATATATAITDGQGIATSPLLTANATTGNYQAQASVVGIAVNALFDLTNTAATQIVTSITAVSGTPQSATVNTVFAQALQAMVRDAANQPVAGVTVTFALPAAGASATFAGGGGMATATATAITDGQGIATSPMLTANAATGNYQAQASVVGVAVNAFFDLTNTATPISDEPANIVALNGAAQVATVNTVFAYPLRARVLTADNQPVVGVAVHFALPVNGVSAAFPDGQREVTATSDTQGIATSPSLTANAVAGNYSAIASVDGVATTAAFALINSAVADGNHSAATILVVMGGDSQTASVNTTFAQPLAVIALDPENRPVPDLEVTFTLPASGASAQFPDDALAVAVMTDGEGVATSPALIANAAAGQFTAVATAGALQAGFTLTNRATAPLPSRVVAVAGTAQTTLVNTAFGEPLQAMVLDANQQPLPGIAVSFALPASGAAAAFPGNAANITVASDENGLATTPALSANGTAGDYQAIAAVEGVAQNAVFTLTNSATPIIVGQTPASVVAKGGTPQTAITGSAFAQTLQAEVLDAGGHPVANTLVTFVLPMAGASAAFIGIAGDTATASTNAGGIAVSPVLVANATAGSYTVTAQVSGVAAVASFDLTNEAAVTQPIADSITVDSGTPQSATVNTVFGQPLKALVRDNSHALMAGVAVTFALPASGASALFDNGRNTLTVLTDSNGMASSRLLTANSLDGSYSVIASVAGIVASASFDLTNEAAPVLMPGSITASAGTPQAAEIGAAFAEPLQALVKDTNGAPMADVEVTFTLPTAGASATFAGGGGMATATATAITDGQGIATSPVLTANATTGNYQAQASVTGVTAKALFALTNTAATQIVTSITAVSGTPQSATVNTVFAQALQVIVRDAANQPVAGVTVTFTLPATGASATFAGGGGMATATATAITDSQGIATSPLLTANATTGNYQAQAAVAGVTAKALFALTNISTLVHTAPTFSGTSATGTGTVSASVSGGGPNCAFDLDRTYTAQPSGLMMNLLGKYLLPHGVLEFVLVGCNVGSTVTVTTTWPSLKGITGYMKYGPTPWLPKASIWYLPNNLKISGNSVSYTITDGGLGDDDLTKNGEIRDPGGPVIEEDSPLAQAIPVLGPWALALLLLIVAVSGYRRARRR